MCIYNGCWQEKNRALYIASNHSPSQWKYNLDIFGFSCLIFVLFKMFRFLFQGHTVIWLHKSHDNSRAFLSVDYVYNHKIMRSSHFTWFSSHNSEARIHAAILFLILNSVHYVYQPAYSTNLNKVNVLYGRYQTCIYFGGETTVRTNVFYLSATKNRALRPGSVYPKQRKAYFLHSYFFTKIPCLLSFISEMKTI